MCHPISLSWLCGLHRTEDPSIHGSRDSSKEQPGTCPASMPGDVNKQAQKNSDFIKRQQEFLSIERRKRREFRMQSVSFGDNSWYSVNDMVTACSAVLWDLQKNTIWPSRGKPETHWVTSNICCIALDLSWGASLPFQLCSKASFPPDRGDSEPMKRSFFQLMEKYYWMSYHLNSF